MLHKQSFAYTLAGILPLVLAAPVPAPVAAVSDSYTFYNGQAESYPLASSWYSDADSM